MRPAAAASSRCRWSRSADASASAYSNIDTKIENKITLHTHVAEASQDAMCSREGIGVISSQHLTAQHLRSDCAQTARQMRQDAARIML